MERPFPRMCSTIRFPTHRRSDPGAIAVQSPICMLAPSRPLVTHHSHLIPCNSRPMRTNIVIDDTLMEDVLQATGLKTKREAVELGLRTLLRLHRQARIRSFRGKLTWEGDLDVLRTDA